MTIEKRNSWGLRIAAAIAVVFGVLTIVSGGRALFGEADARAAVGNAVPFVLWFNFLSGFVYVAAGVWIAMRKEWGGTLATVLAVAIIAVFVLRGRIWTPPDCNALVRAGSPSRLLTYIRLLNAARNIVAASPDGFPRASSIG